MIKFGTGGFRGVIADDFTKDNVCRIAQGLAEIAKMRGWLDLPVAVGYDYRFMSDRFAEWTAEVLAAGGLKVLLFDCATPTPVVMGAVKELNLELGVMITASHNPYEFNGVKVFRKYGMDADVEFTDELERVVDGCKTVRSVRLESALEQGLVEKYSYLDRYSDNIISFIDFKAGNNGVSVLFDNLYGTGAVGLKKIAERLGLKRFDVIDDSRDAFFGFKTPNPTVEAMARLKGAVVENGYDFALGTDCDADRLGVLDEKGENVTSNEILACLYYYLVKYRGLKGDVVKNCSTSLLLDMLAEKMGFKCHEVDVGFKNISAKLKETDALIGGESSGGLTVRGYIFGKDSTFAASLFTEMRIVMNKPVSEIVRQVEEFAGYKLCWKEDSCTVADMKVFDVLKTDDGSDVGAEKVVAFNRNVKYYFGGGAWALLRASGTEPVFRIAAESHGETETAALIEKMKTKLKTAL